MKHIVQVSMLAFMLTNNTAHARQQQNFKFDFGAKKASAGYIPVTENTS